MKRPSRIAVCLIVGISIAGAIFWCARPVEPIYRGKTLGQWTDEVPNGVSSESLPTNSGIIAIRAMGTSAAPYAVEMFVSRRSRMRSLITDTVNKLQGTHLMTEEERWRKGRMAVTVLGPLARSEVPSLIRTLGDLNEDREARSRAAIALGLIHSDADRAIPALLDCVKANTNAHDLLPGASLFAIGCFKTEAKSALPFLRQLLIGNNSLLGSSAALAIRKIDPAGEDVGPLLAQELKQPDFSRRWFATKALGALSGASKPPVWIHELLIEAAKDSDAKIAQLARAVLDQSPSRTDSSK